VTGALEDSQRYGRAELALRIDVVVLEMHKKQRGLASIDCEQRTPE
jgi:hypothetical protein